MNLGEMNVKAAAKAAAGNWEKYDSFVWFRAQDLDDADNWAVIYTRNRDSGLLDQSNAHGIEAALDTFTEGNDPDVVAETHSHWAVGWVQGVSIRAYRKGRITKAFARTTNWPNAWQSIPSWMTRITATGNTRTPSVTSLMPLGD